MRQGILGKGLDATWGIPIGILHLNCTNQLQRTFYLLFLLLLLLLLLLLKYISWRVQLFQVLLTLALLLFLTLKLSKTKGHGAQLDSTRTGLQSESHGVVTSINVPVHPLIVIFISGLLPGWGGWFLVWSHFFCFILETLKNRPLFVHHWATRHVKHQLWFPLTFPKKSTAQNLRHKINSSNDAFEGRSTCSLFSLLKSVVPFTSFFGRSEWQVKWPSEKKDYCCKRVWAQKKTRPCLATGDNSFYLNWYLIFVV